MEAIGGNAYVEESILPRLLRDCGAADLVRDQQHPLARCDEGKPPGARSEALFARAGAALEAARQRPALGGPTERVEARLSENARQLERLAGQSLDDQERGAREWVEAAGRTMTLALLLEAAAHPPLETAAFAAFRRLSVRP